MRDEIESKLLQNNEPLLSHHLVYSSDSQSLLREQKVIREINSSGPPIPIQINTLFCGAFTHFKWLCTKKVWEPPLVYRDEMLNFCDNGKERFTIVYNFNLLNYRVTLSTVIGIS